jgi:hypothetical protein
LIQSCSKQWCRSFFGAPDVTGIEKETLQKLEVKIESQGGYLNAYTSGEHNIYFAKV